MKWPEKIELLRPYVLWECRDIPPDLVLAIIQRESGGNIGIEGTGKTRCGTLADLHGNSVSVCHALGLMQTIPATIKWYNESVADSQRATVEDMIGADERAARLQIRVGCKYLAYVNHFLHKKFPSFCPAASLSQASDDQISLVLTGYTVGHGDTLKKIQGLIDTGNRVTFSAIKNAYPDWGKRGDTWVNRPVQYADAVLSSFVKHRGESYDQKNPGEIVRRTVGQMTGKKGAIVAVLFVAGAAYLINRHYTRPRGLTS